MSTLARVAYRRDNSALAGLWTVVLLMVVLAEVCGCSASARNKTIAAAYVTATTTSAAYHDYQAEHQHQHEQDLVAGAADKAAAEAAVADYRKKRDAIEKAFTATFSAIAAAATIENDQTLAAMLSAEALLQQAIAALGVKLP